MITQAQIEAAARAAWERYKGLPWPGNQELWEDAIKAGFVAAAQVGKQSKGPAGDKGQVGWMGGEYGDAAQVGEPDERDDIIIGLKSANKKMKAVTIERCAQVADTFFNEPRQDLHRKIAAAIRKLKDTP